MAQRTNPEPLFSSMTIEVTNLDSGNTADSKSSPFQLVVAPGMDVFAYAQEIEVTLADGQPVRFVRAIDAPDQEPSLWSRFLETWTSLLMGVVEIMTTTISLSLIHFVLVMLAMFIWGIVIAIGQ